jgi:hypothetical protein
MAASQAAKERKRVKDRERRLRLLEEREARLDAYLKERSDDITRLERLRQGLDVPPGHHGPSYRNPRGRGHRAPGRARKRGARRRTMPNPPRKTIAALYDRMRRAGYKPKDAKFVADEHAAARELGIEVEWEEDTSADERGLWGVIARNEAGQVLDSLWGIDLGDVGPDAHHSDPYQWDAEAQVISGGRNG